MNTQGNNNMTAMDLSFCNKTPKIKELFNFNEIFSVHLLMNEFYNASIIL